MSSFDRCTWTPSSWEMTDTKYKCHSSLQIMHSCYQRSKHTAWVSAFKVFLQERMKGRIRSLACRAHQLSWGFCESAETVASTFQSDIWACKPSRALAGRWKQAAYLSAFVYQTWEAAWLTNIASVFEKSSADTINCHRARLSQYLLCMQTIQSCPLHLKHAVWMSSFDRCTWTPSSWEMTVTKYNSQFFANHA